MMHDLAPVVLFVYNRPAHTARTLQALAANPLAMNSDLIIFADGPKKSEHEPMVAEARAVARRASGFRSVRLIERDRNMGLARSIMEGVAQLCAEHGRVIVVEDDLVVARNFLRFMNDGLARYRDEAEVLQVSGYSYPAHDGSTAETFFLPMISCWGWATWARAWAHFEPEMSGLAKIDVNPALRRAFNIDNSYDYYGMACQQRDGKLDSWGIKWQLSLFVRKGLVLYPRQSLVYNAGTDASGTHGRGQVAFQRELGGEGVQGPATNWPDRIVVDDLAFGQVRQLLRANRPGVFRRMIGRLRT